jgi:hypothetical protein
VMMTTGPFNCSRAQQQPVVASSRAQLSKSMGARLPQLLLHEQGALRARCRAGSRRLPEDTAPGLLTSWASMGWVVRGWMGQYGAVIARTSIARGAVLASITCYIYIISRYCQQHFGCPAHDTGLASAGMPFVIYYGSAVPYHCQATTSHTRMALVGGGSSMEQYIAGRGRHASTCGSPCIFHTHHACANGVDGCKHMHDWMSLRSYEWDTWMGSCWRPLHAKQATRQRHYLFVPPPTPP